MAAAYIERQGKFDSEVRVAILCPTGDSKIITAYKGETTIVEGDEKDVLSRYVKAQAQFNADHVVRITADCVFISPHLIAKHIKSALIKGRDYTTNTIIRTWMEGLDVEVMSKRLIAWLDENVKDAHHREHVTSYLKREGEPFPLKDVSGKYPSVCHILDRVDLSSIKTSIDTIDDLNHAQRINETTNRKIERAKKAGVVVF